MCNIDRYPIVDEAEGRITHTYKYTLVATVAGRRVRVAVTRNRYQEQCSAAAYVLADNMTWTPLADASPDTWVNDTPPPYEDRLDVAAVLGPIATRLLDRAVAIIT